MSSSNDMSSLNEQFGLKAVSPVTFELMDHVDRVNKFEAPQDHIVFGGDTLYTNLAKDTAMTVEFAQQKIQDAQDQLARITASGIPNGTQYFWRQQEQSWNAIKDSL